MSIFSDKPKDASPNPGTFAVSNTDFDDGLTVGGAGASEKIDQHDCATPDAATRLLAHLVAIGLTDGRLTIDWPLGTFVSGSPFAQSAKVPYIEFPRVPTPDNLSKVHHVNVAHLLVHYTHYPEKFADSLLFQKYGPAQ
jgi:hypothetical protein